MKFSLCCFYIDINRKKLKKNMNMKITVARTFCLIKILMKTKHGQSCSNMSRACQVCFGKSCTIWIINEQYIDHNNNFTTSKLDVFNVNKIKMVIITLR